MIAGASRHASRTRIFIGDRSHHRGDDSRILTRDFGDQYRA